MGSLLPEPLLRPSSSESTFPAETLRRTLRALWGRDIAVIDDADSPHLAQGVIHLPPHAEPPWRLAAAAHAAAHLVFSPPVFDGRGLKPVVRALVGVLEDARVETLAGRELPGLARLWRAQHVVTPLDGDGVDVLLLRLARALADPACDDPHPWVRKGRALFFLDTAAGVMAEPRAERLREIASRLGHDLGQMRLQFNARSHRSGPDYRDDHRWMWPELVGDDAAPPASSPPAGRSAPEVETPNEGTPHPEWDRLIARLRPAWCRVQEGIALPADTPQTPPVDPAPPRSLRRALLGRHATGRWRVQHEGMSLDLDALLRERAARRSGTAIDGRWWRARSRERRVGHVLLLVDQSASTGAARPDGATQLQAASAWAWQAARALAAIGLVPAIAGFSSNGRHAVRWQPVLGFGAPLDGGARARLAALASGGSTRLGAALRHAARQLARHRDGERIVLVVSDADVHDIDVHDPRYLADDAHHAVCHARRQGLRMACLLTDPACAAAARHVFGAAGFAAPTRDDELPRALARLLA